MVWKFNCMSSPLSNALEVGDKVIFGAENKTMYCIEEGTGKEIWRFDQGAFYLGKVSFNKGNIYFAMTGLPDRQAGGKSFCTVTKNGPWANK